MPCSRRKCATHVTEELSWLSPRNAELAMGEALAAWLSWPHKE